MGQRNAGGARHAESQGLEQDAASHATGESSGSVEQMNAEQAENAEPLGAEHDTAPHEAEQTGESILCAHGSLDIG